MKHCSQQAFETTILDALFGGFEKRAVRYAVLRNFECLPRSVGARDIDIIVHSDDLSAACGVVTCIGRAHGLRYGNYFADERLTQFSMVGRDAAGGLVQIKIDFFNRSEAFGVEYLSAEDMLCSVRDHNGVRVVADSIMLLDKWVFHLLVGRPLHSKYDSEFAAIAVSEGAALTRSLSRFLSQDRAAALVESLADGKGSTLALDTCTRRWALCRLWAAQGTSAMVRSLRFLAYRIRDLLRPNGVFLSVSGPDGSGKTTVINMVIEQLEAIYGESAVHCAHFRPTVLPRIAEVAQKSGAVKTIDENYGQPHRAKPSGFAGSALRLAYYWLDYLGGYFRSVHPLLRRREVVLFDRYYHDMIADSFRSRIALPMPLLQLMGRLLPLPQYCFFIRVDPDVIHRRKKELTFERIVELNGRYEDLVQRGWLIPIDNGGAPEDAAAAIVDHVVAKRHAEAERLLR